RATGDGCGDRVERELLVPAERAGEADTRPVGRAGGTGHQSGSQIDVELDRDIVVELQRAEERRVRPDSPYRLRDRRRAACAPVDQVAVDGHRADLADDRQVAVDA